MSPFLEMRVGDLLEDLFQLINNILDSILQRNQMEHHLVHLKGIYTRHELERGGGREVLTHCTKLANDNLGCDFSEHVELIVNSCDQLTDDSFEQCLTVGVICHFHVNPLLGVRTEGHVYLLSGLRCRCTG